MESAPQFEVGEVLYLKRGDHASHNGVRVLGQGLKFDPASQRWLDAVLVRCRGCLYSWTFTR